MIAQPVQLPFQSLTKPAGRRRVGWARELQQGKVSGGDDRDRTQHHLRTPLGFGQVISPQGQRRDQQQIGAGHRRSGRCQHRLQQLL